MSLYVIFVIICSQLRYKTKTQWIIRIQISFSEDGLWNEIYYNYNNLNYM